MTNLNKHEFSKFGDTFRLLYVDNDGTKVYLQKHKWDCDWYWGMGYLETFTNNNNPEKSYDISSHFHFSSFDYKDWEKVNSVLSKNPYGGKHNEFYFKLSTAYNMQTFAETLHLRRTAWSMDENSVIYNLCKDFDEKLLNEKLGKLLDEIWDMLE